MWFPSYAVGWGPVNFLNLCDLAVILTCLGLWRGSALLLSSQAVSSLVVDLLWTLDVGWRLVLGRRLIGGTDYLWDARWPVVLRLASLFHVVWPVLLLWSLRRVGYDRRGLALQSAIAAVALVAAQLADPAANIDYARRAPLLDRPFGPPPVHVGLTLVGLVGAFYLPTHLLLARLFPPPPKAEPISDV